MAHRDNHTVYALIGEEGFERLVRAFYRRIPEDDILNPMYPAEDLPGAEARLRAFLIFRFGGPDDYLAQRGHPRLRMRHAPFPIDRAARDRWVTLMTAALDEMQFPPEADERLRTYFQDGATVMMNRGNEQGMGINRPE
ncbi:MAG: globin [Anaerolineae bacterium]